MKRLDLKVKESSNLTKTVGGGMPKSHFLRMNKVKTFLVMLALIGMSVSAAYAETASQLKTIIESFNHGGTGTLSTSVSGNTVTVTGTVTGVKYCMYLVINAGVTVLWKAAYSGTDDNMLRIYNGAFEVAAGGAIVKNGEWWAAIVGLTNISPPTIKVSGGTVRCTGSAAIASYTVEISGGTVETKGTDCAIDGDTVTISGGTVSATAGSAVYLPVGGKVSVLVLKQKVKSAEKIKKGKCYYLTIVPMYEQNIFNNLMFKKISVQIDNMYFCFPNNVWINNIYTSPNLEGLYYIGDSVR